MRLSLCGIKVRQCVNSEYISSDKKALFWEQADFRDDMTDESVNFLSLHSTNVMQREAFINIQWVSR